MATIGDRRGRGRGAARRIGAALLVASCLAAGAAAADGKVVLEDPRQLSPRNAGLVVAGVAVLLVLLAAGSD